MSHKISIAIATYNGANYIGEQLASFAAQRRLPDELVVTDDVSTDQTVAIVEEFAQAAPFKVRIERNRRNLNFTHNFEKALSLCTGDVIFMSDQDDVWFPNKIARALYKNAKVLVLDKATSALDTETEKSVMGSISQLGDDLTIPIIAHRLTTVAACDAIVRLDEDRIIALGSREVVFPGMLQSIA